MSERLVRQMFALLRMAEVQDRDKRLELIGAIVCRQGISTTRDLSVIELQAVVDTLDYWKRTGELKARCDTPTALKRSE